MGGLRVAGGLVTRNEPGIKEPPRLWGRRDKGMRRRQDWLVRQRPQLRLKVGGHLGHHAEPPETWSPAVFALPPPFCFCFMMQTRQLPQYRTPLSPQPTHPALSGI